MAKDYGRKRPTKRKSNAPQHVFWVFAAFVGGYLTATVFDLTSLSNWVSKNVLATHKEAKPAAQVTAKEPEVPKPKFEFYTLLSKDHAQRRVNTASPAMVAATKPPATSSASAVGTALIAPKQAGTLTKQADAVTVVEAKSVAAVRSSKDAYQIQIASFKNKQDAEHLKAALTLKGFDVRVVAVAQPQGNWFRVIVGPFNSRAAVEKAQLNLAQTERIKGMIRKVDV